jgi:hypothetical protein
MAPSDICALDNGIGYLHFRQSPPLEIPAFSPQTANHLKLQARFIVEPARQQIDDD